MGSKVRKQIYLEAEQERSLKYLSQRSGMSEAELIRQAIDLQLSGMPVSPRGGTAWKAELAYIRRLMRKGSIPGGRTWRREDLYDR